MASPAEVANDLRSSADHLQTRGIDQRALLSSMRRGAETIFEMIAKVEQLEGELQRFRDDRSYVVGFNDGFAEADGEVTSP